MGIHSLGEAKTYGLTLVLGGGEVTLLDITSAYGVFANEGVRIPPTPVLSVTDKDGNIIEEYQKTEVQAIPKNVALQISDVLSDNAARTPTFGANSPLYFPGRDVAAKTGTTNDNRDAWLVGYTPTIAVGVWSGNNDNSKMTKGGSAVSGPLWHSFMAEALKIMPNEQFETPDLPANYASLKPILRGKWQGGQSYYIDTVSGGLANEFTPEETKREIVTGEVHDILYWVDKNDPTGPAPSNPNDDPQYHLWEPGVRNWVAAHGGGTYTGSIPSYTDNVHTNQNNINLQILSPSSGGSYSANSSLSLSVAVSGPNPIKKVDYFMNDVYIGTSEFPPFTFNITPSSVNGNNALNTLKAIATDSVFNKKEATVSFTLTGM
jgi:membrane peptidoglycan carboxypeptidase